MERRRSYTTLTDVAYPLQVLLYLSIAIGVPAWGLVTAGMAAAKRPGRATTISGAAFLAVTVALRVVPRVVEHSNTLMDPLFFPLTVVLLAGAVIGAVLLMARRKGAGASAGIALVVAFVAVAVSYVLLTLGGGD